MAGIQCATCEFFAPSLAALISHLSEQHLQNYTPVQPSWDINPISLGKLQCDLIELHPVAEDGECIQIIYTADCSGEQRLSSLLHQSLGMDADSGSKLLRCSKDGCKRSTPSFHLLANHIAHHLAYFNARCVECNEQFTALNIGRHALARHVDKNRIRVELSTMQSVEKHFHQLLDAAGMAQTFDGERMGRSWQMPHTAALAAANATEIAGLKAQLRKASEVAAERSRHRVDADRRADAAVAEHRAAMFELDSLKNKHNAIVRHFQANKGEAARLKEVHATQLNNVRQQMAELQRKHDQLAAELQRYRQHNKQLDNTVRKLHTERSQSPDEPQSFEFASLTERCEAAEKLVANLKSQIEFSRMQRELEDAKAATVKEQLSVAKGLLGELCRKNEQLEEQCNLLQAKITTCEIEKTMKEPPTLAHCTQPVQQSTSTPNCDVSLSEKRHTTTADSPVSVHTGCQGQNDSEGSVGAEMKEKEGEGSQEEDVRSQATAENGSRGSSRSRSKQGSASRSRSNCRRRSPRHKRSRKRSRSRSRRSRSKRRDSKQRSGMERDTSDRRAQCSRARDGTTVRTFCCTCCKPTERGIHRSNNCSRCILCRRSHWWKNCENLKEGVSRMVAIPVVRFAMEERHGMNKVANAIAFPVCNVCGKDGHCWNECPVRLTNEGTLQEQDICGKCELCLLARPIVSQQQML